MTRENIVEALINLETTAQPEIVKQMSRYE